MSALALSACGGAEAERTPGDFISDNPTGGGDDYYGEDDIGAAEETGDSGEEGAGTGEDDNGGDTLEVLEADIVQIVGDTLYALSSYSGLTVVDVTNPDDMRSLGTWKTDAEPFEMYVEGDQAFVMFNNYYFWTWDEEFDEWSENSSSRLVALDASDPANIQVRGEFTLPGRIQDSRRVGDILYLVTMEDGWCWECDGTQQTVVTSLDISDTSNPVVVEQLSLPSPGDSWDWERSVESTSERIYMASRTWAWQGLGSIIDVVDISAGDGSLVAGAQVPVDGSVFSRWQMNEYGDVLRVISQSDWSTDPKIETWTIESSDSFVPLGSGDINIPVPESLRSARFDGDRAYAITAEQTDPLFTIDLSDPANPQQKGELEIPGWVYHMETRDDRILALGYDPSNAAGAINVSLFDVSDFDAPALRKRVHFGGDWADFAEDQNRIHKAFTILDDEELLLVPYSGWDWSSNYECSGSYRSGVQLIDWMDDDLTLRGVAPSRGRARRALLHKQRVLTVSDLQLASFDFSDRDAPVSNDDLMLAVQVDDLVHSDDVWVRISRDWWTNNQVLEIVDGDDPTASEPLGVINLEAPEDEGMGCSWRWVEDLFAVGDHVFVVETVYAESWDEGYENYDYKQYARLVSVDVSDPTNPMVDDELDIPGSPSWGPSSLGNVVTSSKWMVNQGQSLVMLTTDDDGLSNPVQVVDLSNPAALEISATLERPEGQTQGMLSVLSDTVVSWHTEPVEGQPGKVRFYFDRLDLDGQPAWAPAVNVPGIVVAYDADAGRLVTVDFEIETIQATTDDCFSHPKYWQIDWDEYDWENEDQLLDCQLISHTLEHLEVDGQGAYLIESVEFEGDYGLEQLFATDTRIFAKLDRTSWTYDENEYDYEYEYDTKLSVFDISDEALPRTEHDGEAFGHWWQVNAVSGPRAVIREDYTSLGLVDASDVEQVEIQHSALPGWGGCYSPVIEGDKVYCPMGSRGLEVVEW
ncbi:beta-propeller domain-containing protein [Pseudenhygromyxa sp. WMMC2535]|nr:beta-propeller domain-containing protein [Pseudenhygromyxa sp. WMMC2535]